jgi:phosphatidylglycerol lysyltransferase
VGQAAGGQGALALRNGSLFLLHVLTFFVLGYGVLNILRPVRFARSRPVQEQARVSVIVRRYGKLATVHFALGGDKSFFWSGTGRAVIAYRVIHGVALALGDPIGPQEEYAPLLQAFLAFCRRQDWPVAFYQASVQTHHLCQAWGLHTYKMGKDALIDVANFTLLGKRGAPVRHAISRARRAGLSVRCWQGEILPEAVFAGMQRISTQWLGSRKVQTQMGFSMGRFPADWSKGLLTVVAADSAGQVQAFLTWTPLYAGNGWALDVMRRGEKTPPGAMELLIAHAIEWAQARGYARMSLGLAPLAGLDGEVPATMCDAVEPGLHASTSSLLERCAASLYRRGMVLGTYRSLYAFKAKFQPIWEDRCLIVSEGQALPRILLALARVHGSGWGCLLQEAWRTARPLNTMRTAVAKQLHARWPPLEGEQTEGQRGNL